MNTALNQIRDESVKHTALPWRLVYRNLEGVTDWVCRIPYAIEAMRDGVKGVIPVADICDQPEAEANANLFFAAPDMLAALKGILADCDEYVRINKLHAEDGRPASNHSMEMARAAIAKATEAEGK